MTRIRRQSDQNPPGRNARVRTKKTVARSQTTLLSLGVVVAIVIAVGASYASSLSATLVIYDRPHIFANDRITSVFPLGHTLSGRRPMVDLTLAFNYAVGRFDPTGYHAFNVLTHLLAALTLFGILKRLLGRRDDDSRPAEPQIILMAGTIALLWAVHPLQTQAVTYVIQRGESMMGLFYLLTLYCAVRGMARRDRQTMWCLASVVACALGMATKAVMITAPLAVFLYDWLLETRSVRETIRRRWALYVGLGATSLILVFAGVVAGVLATGPRPRANVGFAVEAVTPLAYLMTQPGVLLQYLRLSVWPHPLCIDYDWPLATGIHEALLPGVVVAALMVTTLWALWRHRRLGFAGACFFLILLPTSSFIPIRDPLFEHRMYLSLAPVLTLLVLGGLAILDRVTAPVDSSGRSQRMVFYVVVVAAVAVLGFSTFRRNLDYHTEIRLWQSAITARPQSTRAHYSLAVALGRAKRQEESLAAFRKVLEVGGERTRPDAMAETHYQIGWILIRAEQPSEAVQAFEAALSFEPDHVEAMFEMGYGLAMLRDYDRAVDVLRRTLELDPDHRGAHNALARLSTLRPEPGRSP